MEYEIPRILLAGTNSGCGKTTVTCAILQAFVNRGLKAGSFKCGPDYIDPMFHSSIIGAPSTNLDPFFFPENTLKYLLAKNGSSREINVIEGVMGFYDGLGLTTQASTYAVSQALKTPAVLIVNAKGASISTLAVIEGFLNFRPDSHICGVILNQCSPLLYSTIAPEIHRRFTGRVHPLGFLPLLPDCSLASRHLGLITPQEVQTLREKLKCLAEQAELTLDLDKLLSLAKAAPGINCVSEAFPRQQETVRIALAQDRAFCFYYEDNLCALHEMGAELVPFSPLSDQSLPPNIHGLYLGGGYPELYAQELSQNCSMRSCLKAALERKLPCIAECGGFMYLTEAVNSFPSVGFLPGKTYDTGRLTRFGYVQLYAKRDNMLCKAGEAIRAHEFHHWDSTEPGDAFTAEKRSGARWDCIHASDTLYAGYPHLHFYSTPSAAVHFYHACVKEKHRHD